MNEIIESTLQTAESAIAETKMEVKNDVKLPPRSIIRQELLKVSNFTEAEVSILWWSSLYKAYSLIVRYEQKGVEEEFRNLDWFQSALKKAVPDNKHNLSNSVEYDYNFDKEKKTNHTGSYDYTVHIKKKSNKFSEALSKN